MPVGCETTGAWGKQAQGFISKLAHFGSMHCGDSVSSVSAQVWNVLSAVLAKAIARQLLRAFGDSSPSHEGEEINL